MTWALVGGLAGAAVLGALAAAFWPRAAAPPDAAPLARRCPACGADLAPGETILAERLGAGTGRDGRERILIKGCTHCLGSARIKG